MFGAYRFFPSGEAKVKTINVREKSVKRVNELVATGFGEYLGQWSTGWCSSFFADTIERVRYEMASQSSYNEIY